jgi:hypothetical protein
VESVPVTATCESIFLFLCRLTVRRGDPAERRTCRLRQKRAGRESEEVAAEEEAAAAHTAQTDAV